MTDETTPPRGNETDTPAPAAVTPPEDDDIEIGTRGIVRLAGGFYGIVAVFAIGYAIFDRVRSEKEPEELGPLLGLAFPQIGLVFGALGVGLAIVGVLHVGRRSLPAVEEAARTLARVFGPLTLRQALILAALSAVAEELLFRGALWDHLGLLGTTFLFALVHIIPRRALWGYPLFAFGAGLLFGLLRHADASDSVLPPIVAHFTVNALNLWWLGANHTRLTAEAANDG